MNLKYLLTILVFTCFCNVGFAKIHSVNTNLEDTTKQAALVIVGKVVKIIPYGEDRLAVIQVERVIKGKEQQGTLKVFFYGPILGGNKTSVDEEIRMLRFEENEKALVFLNKSSEGIFYVENHDLGKLRIVYRYVNIPQMYQKNNKLKEVEPLDEIIRLIEGNID